FTPDGRVWLANYPGGGLLRLDPATRTMERLITPVPPESDRTAFTGAFRLAVDGSGHVWAVESIWDRLVRIESLAGGRTGLELLPLPHNFRSPVGIVVDDGTIWTTEHPGTRLLRWRPAAGDAAVVQLWPTTDEGYPV